VEERDAQGPKYRAGRGPLSACQRGSGTTVRGQLVPVWVESWSEDGDGPSPNRAVAYTAASHCSTRDKSAWAGPWTNERAWPVTAFTSRLFCTTNSGEHGATVWKITLSLSSVNAASFQEYRL